MTAKWTIVPKSLTESIRATKTEYRQVGKSGLRVSNPILGGMSFGDPRWLNWVLDEKEALPVLNAAFRRGINTWDTANVYSNGASERIIGNAMRKVNIPRHKVVIMTKCHRTMVDEADHDPGSMVAFMDDKVAKSKDYVNQYGLSRSAIFRAVEGSLRRLDTDYIDILQVHRFDNTVPPEETMRALDDLVRSGKVRYIGASSMWAHQLATLQFVAEKNGWTKFISMQSHYSLLYREEEREVIKYCDSTGVGLLAWSPLAAGHLARAPQCFGGTARSAGDMKGPRFPTGQSSADKEIIRRVQEIAQKRRWAMSQVALAWINKRVTAPVVGLSSIEKIDEVLEARGKTLTEDEEKYLEEPYMPKEIQGHE
ncbi:MAG: hypothetical protein M1813_007082 [Trichoglossum hirsutum]|nr:MAG: hypothetical protein M1813_007082 [Trichoglossum hirsutum]